MCPFAEFMDDENDRGEFEVGPLNRSVQDNEEPELVAESQQCLQAAQPQQLVVTANVHPKVEPPQPVVATGVHPEAQLQHLVVTAEPPHWQMVDTSFKVIPKEINPLPAVGAQRSTTRRRPAQRSEVLTESPFKGISLPSLRQSLQEKRSLPSTKGTSSPRSSRQNLKPLHKRFFTALSV